MNTTLTTGKNHRAEIAAETLHILQRGCYENNQGQRIEIAAAVERAVRHSRAYSTEELQMMRQQELRKQEGRSTLIELTRERTIACTQRLVQEEQHERVCCLNFASARNPGGGFLNGAQAQEESLARASALYLCQLSEEQYYHANRKTKSCFYTDYSIYAPNVPVLRNADDELLEQAYVVSMITAPAVNAGVVREREAHNIAFIESVMLRRIENILRIALQHEQRVLVLGAWGCGVFRNNPHNIARYFSSLLGSGAIFANVFERVVFAVYDSSKQQQVYTAFADVLGSKGAMP